MSREQFEKEYAEDHGMPIETFEQYRMGDSYRLPMIAKCWRFYQKGEAKSPAQSTANAFQKGFNTLETGNGKPKIVMEFACSDDAFAAYRAMGQLSRLEKVKS